MNKLLLLGLIGGGLYWLLRQQSPHEQSRLWESERGSRDMDDLRTDTLDRDEEQRLLDEALAETFPASDPPAVSTPRRSPGV